MRRILAGLGVLAVLGVLLAGWAVVSTRRALALMKDPEGLARQINPPPGPATDLDRVFAELAATFGALPAERPLWGVRKEDEALPVPGPGAAEASLAARAGLRARLVQALAAGAEPDGTGPVLNEVHMFKVLRELHGALLEDFLSLLAVGRGPEACALFGALERMRRILGRGIEGSPTLVAKMIALSFLGVGTRALSIALEGGLLDAGSRAALGGICREGEARVVPIEVSIRAELAMVDRAVEAVDQRLGPVWVLTRVYWGSGKAQVARFRAALDSDSPPPSSSEIAGMHPMVRIGVPNFVAAKVRDAERRELRAKVVARLAG